LTEAKQNRAKVMPKYAYKGPYIKNNVKRCDHYSTITRKRIHRLNKVKLKSRAQNFESHEFLCPKLHASRLQGPDLERRVRIINLSMPTVLSANKLNVCVYMLTIYVKT